MTRVATTCPYCGVGCGVSATVESDQLIAVSGDEAHPANAGRLCVKGTALAETMGREGRLLHPSLHGGDISWDVALDTVAAKLRETSERYGPEAIAFYLSGQLLTEDYYVANKLAKGFLGSANVDTNSRLCMSSAVAGYKRAFGEDIVPCSYQDLEDCDLLVMVGSNAAWTHPVVYQRLVAAKQRNPHKRVVVIDTRRTATCDIADLHLQLAPGSDGFLFGGLLHYLAAGNRLDQGYLERHVDGLSDALAAADGLDIAAVQRSTGLAEQELQTFYQWFAETPNTVTLYSQGINQSATGTDKCNAIINCHLATGRIGKPGAGPFSITGQPNAMGGREVGGLANQLAAHMDFEPADVERVGRFWGATDMVSSPGLKAVDMFKAAAEGRIRFLWIMATNPAVSLPDSAMVRKALANCDFVVVSDCTGATDTAALADLLLPALGWGEKDGTVTNSERVISRQRGLVTAPGEARPDWWIISEVARRLGFETAFNYSSPAAIFREHAALSTFENNGSRAFDIGALATLDDDAYADMAPQRWPLPVGGEAREPLADGHFYTRSGRAFMVPVQARLPETHHALTVNSGRLRDQWHTMTRTGLVPRLARHRDFFSLSLSPEDAGAKALQEGDLARLEGAQGAVCGLVSIDPGLPAGQCFLPIHWSGQFASAGRVSELMPAVTDAVSGQPQSKHAGAVLKPVTVDSWGMLFSREPVALPGLSYWSRIAVAGGYLTLLADRAPAAELRSGLLSGLSAEELAVAEYGDPAGGDLRIVARRAEDLAFALYLHPQREGLPSQDWMASLGSATQAGWQLLSGHSTDQASVGKIVCSCWEVGENKIIEAIEAGSCTVDALGQSLGCGTRCGSCIPELKTLLAARHKDCAA